MFLTLTISSILSHAQTHRLVVYFSSLRHRCSSAYYIFRVCYILTFDNLFLTIYIQSTFTIFITRSLLFVLSFTDRFFVLSQEWARTITIIITSIKKLTFYIIMSRHIIAMVVIQLLTKDPVCTRLCTENMQCLFINRNNVDA